MEESKKKKLNEYKWDQWIVNSTKTNLVFAKNKYALFTVHEMRYISVHENFILIDINK